MNARRTVHLARSGGPYAENLEASRRSYPGAHRHGDARRIRGGAVAGFAVTVAGFAVTVAGFAVTVTVE